MRGGVRKRGKTWFYYFDAGVVDGKRNKIERKGGRTKDEAEAALRAAITEYENCGTITEESDISVVDYFDYWFENYVLVNCKYNTQESYRIIIERHIKPVLGMFKLRHISSTKLQEFLNKKFIEGYAKSSVLNFYGVLSGGFRAAFERFQLIKANPMDRVHMPTYPAQSKSKKRSEDSEAYTFEQIQKITERFPEGSTFYIPVQVGFHTGFRPAEICGLTWDCIDLELGTITVDKITVKHEHEWTLGTPKTESSYRTINIGATLVAILARHKQYQDENREKYGKYYANLRIPYVEGNKVVKYYTNLEMVCTKENGQIVTTDTLKYLSRVVNYELGIEYKNHRLRHTHATILLENGAEMRDIQERLGHKHMATTAGVYTHVTQRISQNTVDKFEQAIKENLPPPE